MKTDRPNLDIARDITRTTGPVALIVGLVIAALGLSLLNAASGKYMPAVYGLLIALFGWACYARTETTAGRIAQWLITIVFVSGAAVALLKWVTILWGSGQRNYTDGGDPAMVAILLTAGPALMVPGLIAAIRPGWTPLIAFPALVSIAFAAAFGYGALIPLGMPDGDPMLAYEPWVLAAISLASLWVLISGIRATKAALGKHEE